MFLLGVSEESNDNRVGFMIIEKNLMNLSGINTGKIYTNKQS